MIVGSDRALRSPSGKVRKSVGAATSSGGDSRKKAASGRLYAVDSASSCGRLGCSEPASHASRRCVGTPALLAAVAVSFAMLVRAQMSTSGEMGTVTCFADMFLRTLHACQTGTLG